MYANFCSGEISDAPKGLCDTAIHGMIHNTLAAPRTINAYGHPNRAESHGTDSVR